MPTQSSFLLGKLLVDSANTQCFCQCINCANISMEKTHPLFEKIINKKHFYSNKTFFLYCLLWANSIFQTSLAFSFVHKEATWSSEVNGVPYFQVVQVLRHLPPIRKLGMDTSEIDLSKTVNKAIQSHSSEKSICPSNFYVQILLVQRTQLLHKEMQCLTDKRSKCHSCPNFWTETVISPL